MLVVGLSGTGGDVAVGAAGLANKSSGRRMHKLRKLKGEGRGQQ